MDVLHLDVLSFTHNILVVTEQSLTHSEHKQKKMTLTIPTYKCESSHMKHRSADQDSDQTE